MDRYRSIIDEWSSFRKASEKNAVTSIRKNTIKSEDDFEEMLRERFEKVDIADWNENIFRLPGTDYPGKSMLHWRGEYYVQEESAALPASILDPGPGESVLDMCAAPGGKTSQIAALMEDSGHVVANDSSGRRLKSLHANIYRTGSSSVTVTNYDGRSFPEKKKFDRVLVDAPCSGEGDRFRRDFSAAEISDIENLSKLQEQLLEKAARLVKDDGEIVYSTCTIAPEENESVVSNVIESTGLELLDINTGVQHSKGVEEFQDMFYGDELGKTVRVYPHHLSSGVIFVARLGK